MLLFHLMSVARNNHLYQNLNKKHDGFISVTQWWKKSFNGDWRDKRIQSTRKHQKSFNKGIYRKSSQNKLRQNKIKQSKLTKLSNEKFANDCEALTCNKSTWNEINRFWAFPLWHHKVNFSVSSYLLCLDSNQS